MWLNELYHHLDPVALSLGPLQIRWYGLAYLAGFILGCVVMYRRQKRWGLNISVDDLMSVVIAVAFGVILGGRLGYVIFYGAGYYLQNPLHIFALSEGGMSFHGGLVGSIFAGWIACRQLKLSFLTLCDLVVQAAPLGLLFGRCANFVNGELWGKPTTLPWGVIFETGGNVARHPSQLYEALLEGLLMFVVLWALSRKQPARPQASFIGTFLLLYGVFRFLVEFVRVPDAQLGYLWGGLTMGQLLSLPLVLAGAVVIALAYKFNRPQRGLLD